MAMSLALNYLMTFMIFSPQTLLISLKKGRDFICGGMAPKLSGALAEVGKEIFSS